MDKKTVKAWAVLDRNKLPQVGNGGQWQWPVFPTEREAKEYSTETHGFNEIKIVRCEITYELPTN